jgi:phage I-like protein
MTRTTPSRAATAAHIKPGKQVRHPAGGGAKALAAADAEALVFANAASAVAQENIWLKAQLDRLAGAYAGEMEKVCALKEQVAKLTAFVMESQLAAVVDAAISDGRVVPSMRGYMINMGRESGLPGLEAFLRQLPSLADRHDPCAAPAAPAAAAGASGELSCQPAATQEDAR